MSWISDRKVDSMARNADAVMLIWNVIITSDATKASTLTDIDCGDSLLGDPPSRDLTLS